MASASDQPVLRLVGRDRPQTPVRVRRTAPKPSREMLRAIASENAAAGRAAQRLDATDARWVLAIRVAEAIEGGRAAILTPERRHRINRLAIKMGLREFDASLVMAIVQDAARTGELERSGLGEAVEQRLAMVRDPAGGSEVGSAIPWWAVIATIALAAVLWLGAILWLEL